ncbi:MAG: tetratricopeptide repeat protein, partial [Myxococcales bacterium]|nr:tetratricopeptide repeat protein [Myxococcales bacterium]
MPMPTSLLPRFTLSSTRRAALAATLLGALLVSTPGLAATNPAAERLNDEGKALFKTSDYAGAVEKFNAAIVLAPDARFYFNLCVALDRTGRLEESLQACDEVYAHQPTNDLKGKTGQKAADVRARKRQQEASAAAGGAGAGGAGDGAGA